MSETLLVERDGEIVIARFNRPQRRNALNTEILDELRKLLENVEQDDGIRALVVTGNEVAFSAGQDLKEPETPDYVPLINDVFNRLERLAKPTVAAIDGWCLAGGLELALCCDMRVASATARIGDWHARINSIGGAGATVRLTRLLGIAKAKELVFSGVAFDGEPARSFGLVSYVYDSGDLVDRAIEHARTLSAGHPLTVKYAKRSIEAATELPLNEALAFSLRCQSELRATVDQDLAKAASIRKA